MLHRLIHLYLGRGKNLLDSFIEVGVINAHSPLLIRFLNHDDIRQPSWIHDFADETNV